MKLNLRSVDLNLLPVFEAIMDAGQLSRAAEELGMSQPAVSAALQRLRTTLGDDLFTRTRQGLNPTPRALELHQQIHESLNILRESLDPDPGFDPHASKRHFRIHGSDYFESVLMPGLLNDLKTEAPEVMIESTLEADSRTLVNDLLQARKDLAIDPFQYSDPRLSSEVLLYESVMVVARRDHPAIQSHCTRQQFLEAQHVVLPERDRQLPLDYLLNQPGWQRKIGAQVSRFSSLLSVCAQSDLIASVPSRLASLYAEPLHLQVLEFPLKLPPIPVYLVWAKALSQDPAHHWMRRKLMEVGEKC